MKDNDIEDMLDLTFTVNEEVFGQVRLLSPLTPSQRSFKSLTWDLSRSQSGS